MSDDDFELLNQWRAGDQQAGNELFRRHFQAVYRFFQNKLDEGIEDLVQQTFLACVEARERLREGGSFRSYLFAVARNRLYMHYGRRQRQRDTVDFDNESVHDLGKSQSNILADRADQRLLLEGLRRIPLNQQLALELYHWEGLNGRELAAVLDVPEATARSHLRRGLKSLRSTLSGIAESGELLESTLASLDDWAASMQRLLADPAFGSDEDSSPP